ncbi:beta-glucosidase [Solimonas aquatica]|uniref:beta-glucosidase n=1 Tax=Solimonas aquatica TaxID=489703 RepID=A0A1H9GGT2_9GAMM|nr:glycoside hydrolase family 3 N-terminal domain-containing protein [Solimonas aquatica]SEQ49068.1 beta-glucosidase [Solimonas aquatica]
MNGIEDLLARMTLTEKLGQLTMTASSYAVTGPVIAGDSTAAIKRGEIGNLLNMVGAGPVHEMQRLAVEESRLKIPLLIGFDIIHGHRTLFPIPLAEAGLFDDAAWERTAREAALEAAADGLAMTFSPMLDVSREPRWGRTAEGPGEDACLATRIARAKVRGYQTADLSRADSLAACAKHFCAYGGVNAGREYASVDISERTVHEVHLPAFAAAVQEGVVSIMPAFHDLNGIPMSAHGPLLRDWLRREQGFEGVLISDYNAIAELLRHGVAADLPEAAALALNAGMDIDMMANAYRHGLPVALERGLVKMEQIDASVRRVLKLKQQLGLFDDPYRRGSQRESAQTVAQRRQLAREVGARAIVLLKNERDVLPLRHTPRLAVLGPLADNGPEMCGTWWAAHEPGQHISVLAGLRARYGGPALAHAPGVGISEDDESGIADALACMENREAVILCLGEAARMSGEAASRACPELPGKQRVFAEAVFHKARALQIPVIVVLFSGRPLIVPWLCAQADAVLAAWFLGSEAGNALADVLSGAVNPSGKTPMSWPRALGQVPVFYGQRPTGRPMDPNDYFTSKYWDVPNDPLYVFGHGLSYARFEYESMRLSASELRETDTLEVEVTLRNSGAQAGEETVLLFVRDRVASVARPLLELKGYAKLALQPGERGSVTLRLPMTELRFLGADLKPVHEPGEVEILAGPCADRAQLLQAVLQLH